MRKKELDRRAVGLERGMRRSMSPLCRVVGH